MHSQSNPDSLVTSKIFFWSWSFAKQTLFASASQHRFATKKIQQAHDANYLQAWITTILFLFFETIC